MIEEEALFAEWERADYQQGSSSEGALFNSVPSARALSHFGAGPGGRQVGEKEVDSNEVEVVYSKDLAIVESEGTQSDTNVEPVVEESHPGGDIILKHPRLKVTNEELNKLRYLFKIPQSVEV